MSKAIDITEDEHGVTLSGQNVALVQVIGNGSNLPTQQQMNNMLKQATDALPGNGKKPLVIRSSGNAALFQIIMPSPKQPLADELRSYTSSITSPAPRTDPVSKSINLKQMKLKDAERKEISNEGEKQVALRMPDRKKDCAGCEGKVGKDTKICSGCESYYCKKCIDKFFPKNLGVRLSLCEYCLA